MLARLTSWARSRLQSRVGWIGVDLGSAVVKVAEVQISPDGCSLARSLVIPRESMFTKTHWSDPATLLPPLAQTRLKNRKGFFDPIAAAALSMSAVDLRAVAVPLTSEDEIGALIEQELQSQDDMGAERRTFDWWDRASSAQADLKHAYALSIPESLTTSVGQSLMGTGVVPHVLDSVPHALARAVSLVWDPETPVGLLDWGYSTATFVVALGGLPVFVRILRSCGLSHWHAAIAQAFDISPEEADRLLREQGLPGASSNRLDEIEEMVANVLRPQQQHLIAELKRTTQYIRNESPCPLPGRLVLFGGGATLPNAVAALESRMEMPASVWEIADSHGEFTGLGPLVGVAVGLSMLGLPQSGGGR
jgi:Tfp pilus assembly PilM family ATPase